MTKSEALTLVGVLSAAFPHFTGGDPTRILFAERLTRYDRDEAMRGIEQMIENRRDTRWPSWAEVADMIAEARPRYGELVEADPEPLSAAEVKRFAGRLFKAKAMPRVSEDPAVVRARIDRARDALQEAS